MNLSAILRKVWANIPLTQEESIFLAQYISSAEGEEVFDREMAGLWDDQADEIGFDEFANFEKIKLRAGIGSKGIAKEEGVRRLRRLLPYAAAAVALIVGLFYWSNRIDIPVQEEFINVAANKVELITADGQKIILDDNQVLPDGFERGENTQNGAELVYTDKSDVADTVINFITLKVPQGETYAMQLPDGTKVFMNAMSTLRFPEKFTADSREVFLDGEAGFSVVSSKQAPFYVRTNQRTVQVTGTKFNVSAYADDQLWSTQLFEGKVSVLGGEKWVLMIPNQQYELNKVSGSSSLKHFAQGEEVFAPWAAGIMDFKSTGLSDIIKQLQRWYDFTVTYEDESIKAKRFTAVVSKDEPLNTFFNTIEQTTDIEITLKGKHITVGKRVLK